MYLPKRKNIRLRHFDYSRNGAYYITICIKDKQIWLWEADTVGARIARPILTSVGKTIESAINGIPTYYSMVTVDKYVIMPNHLHLILVINNDGRAMRAPTVSRVINQMKGYVTKQIGYSMWQKLFYDHIIRDEEDYLRVWQYIDENPLKWKDDEYYCEKA